MTAPALVNLLEPLNDHFRLGAVAGTALMHRGDEISGNLAGLECAGSGSATLRTAA